MTVSSFMKPNLPGKRHRTIVGIESELVRGTEDRVLAELMPQAKQTSIELDLSKVERIDAAGIAVLITLYCTAIQAGNEFRVADPSHRVLELLRVVGLESILVADPLAETPRLAQLGLSAA